MSSDLIKVIRMPFQEQLVPCFFKIFKYPVDSVDFVIKIRKTKESIINLYLCKDEIKDGEHNI